MPHVTTICDTLDDFIQLHHTQLESSGVPERFWSVLFNKLKNEIFDAGESFMIAQVEELSEEDEECSNEGDDADQAGPEQHGAGAPFTESGSEDVSSEVSWKVLLKNEDGIRSSDANQIYLIDHAWTYRVDSARQQLESIPNLLPRMAALMEIKEESDQESMIEAVLDEMWKYNQSYSIGNAALGSESAVPIWYILDEFGSRIQHSNNPSCRMVPFCYVPTQMSYTLLWPIRDLLENDEVTRDYVEGNSDPLIRKLRLLPWHPEDMTHLSYDQHECDSNFYTKYKVHETLPNLDVTFPELPKDRNIKVHTDVDQVVTFMSDPRFELVENVEEADIIWWRTHLNDFKQFSEETPGNFVNQFPFEMVLTVKDLLSVVARRAVTHTPIIDHDSLESQPSWLQTTFNLQSELPQFVSYFQAREKRGLDNTWICKPWNLARALDSHVSGNLNSILRIAETGPKIACKYIEDPVLLNVEGFGLKFDLRFVVLLSSIQPLRMHVHKKFNVRIANKQFSLDHFDDFEKHFTVMNYRKTDFLQIVYTEFISMFESQYPDHPWSAIESEVHQVLLDMVTAAASQPPPKGIAPSPQSRAMYGADIIFKWVTDRKGARRIQPVLLEFNYGPDNTRLCTAFPDFLNEIFQVLFLEDFENEPVVSL